MKLIPLTQGKFAKVDDEDFDYLSQFKWHARKVRRTYYAGRHETKNGKQLNIHMHRVIYGALDADAQVDHINHDGLDNQKENLRVATLQQNMWNQQLKVTSTTGYMGVSKRKGRWLAQIGYESKRFHLGMFDSAKEAAYAYDLKASELRGEFASLNFPTQSLELMEAA